MRHIPWVAALAVCAPLATSAKPVGTFEFVVADPGDQRRPSIDGQYVIYSGPGATGDLDVLLYNTLLETKQVVAGVDAGDPPGDYDDPDVSQSTAIYRGPAGISIEFWQTNQPLRTPTGDGPVASPAIGLHVAAWEVGTGARDVRVNRWSDPGGTREYTLTAPDGGAPVGDQHAPAAFKDLVGYVDERDGGAVWVHDSAAGTFARVCDGAATGLTIGEDGADTVVAVARSTDAHDEDVEVWDVRGGAALAALRVPGVQRNPHVSGAWVAFEDVSTQYSQVVVWNWRTGLVFVPNPSETQQVLNDLSLVTGEEVRVVFEDSESPATGRDIALYRLDLDPFRDDGLPNGYPFETAPPPVEPARCDGTATPLATLHLARAEGKPLADSVRFSVEVPPGAARLPVLLCLDADRVSAAWVALDDEVIASPCDFEPSVVHLEARGEVEGGRARISGVIAGKPGATLDVRVLADPARLEGEPPDHGKTPALQAAAAPPVRGGCATGAGGAEALLALALLLARRRPRRG